MTATPRIFGDESKKKADSAAAVLASMDDEKTFGPELHRLGFGEAVERDLLTDYRMLAVDESYVAENFQHELATAVRFRDGMLNRLLLRITSPVGFEPT